MTAAFHSHPEGDRRFTDEEVRLILRHATELQLSRGATGDLTLAQLREAAADAGIDPRHVDEAAANVLAPANEGQAPFRAGPHRWSLKRLVAGTVSLEHLDRLLHVIRRFMGSKGQVDLVSGRLEWKGDGYVEGLNGVVVALSTRRGITVVDIVANLFIEVAVLRIAMPLLGVFAALILGTIFNLGGGFLLAALLAGGIVGDVGARALWRRRARSFTAKLDALLEQIVSEVAELVQPQEEV